MRGGSIREFVIDCLQRGLDESVDLVRPGTDSAKPDERLNIQLDEDGWPVIARSAHSDGEKA